jgi:hypothetical protein
VGTGVERPVEAEHRHEEEGTEDVEEEEGLVHALVIIRRRRRARRIVRLDVSPDEMGVIIALCR